MLFFRLPDGCAGQSLESCDWPGLGVGAHLADLEFSSSGTFLCCNEEALALDLCAETYEGQLIVTASLFQGHRREIKVPERGNFNATIDNSFLENLEPGDYALVTSNCNRRGRSIQLTGAWDWPKTGNNITNAANSTYYNASEVDEKISKTLNDVGDDNEESWLVRGGRFLKYFVGGVAGFTVLVSITFLYRNREIARWREYRTRQILRAQYEAFDLTEEMDFDLELVESKPDELS